MLNLNNLRKITKYSLLTLGLAWGGIAMALPSCITNYSVSNATLADSGIVNGTWTVDWTQSPPALTAANLAVTGGGNAGLSYVVPGTINNALQAIPSPSTGTFYGANFNATTGSTTMWLMFNVDTGALEWKNGSGYFSVGGSPRTYFNAVGDVGTATASQCAPVSVPTLSEWAMIFMASLLAMIGIRRMRRQ